MKTIVSLVSEQTVPNVELINEFREKANEYWFFYSDKTSDQVGWIKKASALEEAQCKDFKIDAFDPNKISEFLDKIDCSNRDFILNITGGTKVWLMVFYERFKEMKSEIFYLTGQKCTMYKMFPRNSEIYHRLSKPLTLDQYLLALGFKYKKSSPLKSSDLASRIFEIVIKNPENHFFDVYSELHELRNNSRFRSLSFEELSEPLRLFLEQIDFPDLEKGLNRDDIKYLSGDWLEEYVYYKLKKELELSDEFIFTGCVLEKNSVNNEIDVMFVLDHKLYTVECKTAVIEENKTPDGQSKKSNILGATIYKSDSLRNKFGLFCQSSIVTLSELREDDGKPKNNFKMHFDRADLSNIKIISRKNLLSERSMKKLIV